MTAHRRQHNPLAPLYTAVVLAGVGFAGMVSLGAAGESAPVFASQQATLPAAQPSSALLPNLQDTKKSNSKPTLVPAPGHTSRTLAAATVETQLLGQPSRGAGKSSSAPASSSPAATSQPTASSTLTAAGTLTLPTTAPSTSTGAATSAGTGLHSVSGTPTTNTGTVAPVATAPAITPIVKPVTRPIVKPVIPVTRPTTPSHTSTSVTPSKPVAPVIPVKPVTPAPPVTPAAPVTIPTKPAPIVYPKPIPLKSLAPIIQSIIDAMRNHHYHH